MKRRNTHECVQDAYDFLNQRGLIGQGKSIEGRIVEEAIGVPIDPQKPWQFKRPFLKLLKKIKARGLFVTQAGFYFPGFRMYATSETAIKGSSQTLKIYKAACTNTEILGAHDLSEAREEDKHKIAYERIRCARMALAMQKELMAGNIAKPPTPMDRIIEEQNR